MGPVGPAGAAPGVKILRINTDTVITMPTGNVSVIYLVITAPESVTVTLPAAATAIGRTVTITRYDGGGTVTVQPQGSEQLDMKRLPVVMYEMSDSITVTTDGRQWARIGG
jgi:hypothetical protein